MMKQIYILGLFYLISTSIALAQPHQILCNQPRQLIKIENTLDIPEVIDNGDGTISLIHPDQNITDIFSNYIIYDFFQTHPTANPEGELIKYYTIVHNTKDLMNELYDYTFPNTFLLDYHYSNTISTTIIDLLDDKTFRLIKQCYESSEEDTYCPADEQNVPEGFELNLAFDYDEINDIIYVETVGLSPCGNSFNGGYKGVIEEGVDSTENTLQLWTSELGVSSFTDYDQTCHYIESILYAVLDISCNTTNYGNTRLYPNGELGQFVIERENALFATDFLTFEDNELSVSESNLEFIFPYQKESDPFLHIKNSNNVSVTIEIFNITGQVVIDKTHFESNSINISDFSAGLYFIRFSNSYNQSKVFKFLKI